MKILLTEDEEALSRVFATALRHQGYTVDQAFNGQEALELAQQNAYDVIILDIMMPLMSGLEALNQLRDSGNKTYTIMLTAMSEIDDRVNGLDAGADDYLIKPISLKELLARLRSLERRFDNSYNGKILQIGRVRLDTSEQELTAQNAVRLAGKETRMLEYLMLNPDKQLSTSDIFRHVWDKEEDSDEGYVWIYISYLRQKLKAIQANIHITGEKDGYFCLTEKEETSHDT